MTATDPSDPRASSPTILVVDDDAPLRQMLTRLLARAGYRVIAAGDGKEALDGLVQDRLQPDLVLTDVVMPRLSGPDLARRVRELHPQVPIVFMSGYIGPLSPDGERMLDEHLLIQKPFSPDEVVSAVREALEAA